MPPHICRWKARFLIACGLTVGAWTAPLLGAADVTGPIVELNEVTDQPIATHKVPPEYPSKLKNQKVEGSAEVEFVVTTEGRVSQARVVRASHPGFEQPALKAIAQWKFTPGKIAGKPVNTRMYQDLSYSIATDDAFQVVEGGDQKTGQATEASLLLDRESFVALLPARIYVGEAWRKRPDPKSAGELKAALRGLGKTGRSYVALPPDAQLAMAVKKVMPHYPMELRRDNIEGEASFLILIAEDGRIHGVCCTSATHPLFALHGGAALIKWTYAPPQIKGTPVPMVIQQTITFSLGL